MIVYPAVDVRGDQAVQLIGGDPTRERLARPDPLFLDRKLQRGSRWSSLCLPAD